MPLTIHVDELVDLFEIFNRILHIAENLAASFVLREAFNRNEAVWQAVVRP
jgi:hypothetical protein